MKIKFDISNVQDVYPAKRTSVTFSQNGAVVGAAEDADWIIQDVSGNVQDHQFKIENVEGKFTITAFPRAKVFLNGASSSISAKRRVLLNDGDRVSFGDLNSVVRTKFGMKDVRSEEQAVHIMHMDDAEADGQIVIDGQVVNVEEFEPIENIADDPLDGFEEPVSEGEQDPIELLDDTREKRKTKEKSMAKADLDEEVVTTIPDYSNTNVAAVSSRKVVKDDYGFETEVKGNNSHEYYYSQSEYEGDVDQETLRLLALNLGVPLHDVLPDEAPLLLADIGQSLQEAVKGLNHLFVSRTNKAHRFQLANMHIHAIEDNPLKFSKSSSEALDAMFINRGDVHLSGPAAIEESLRHIDQHQQATEVAIDKGLNAVMRALHPKALERRFVQYSRGKMPPEGQERDAWKWKMFEAYVSELTSHRQTGLKMLFWEVFGSSYQDYMRKLDFGIEEEFETEEATGTE